jgi:hypothetical protein
MALVQRSFEMPKRHHSRAESITNDGDASVFFEQDR